MVQALAGLQAPRWPLLLLHSLSKGQLA